MFRQPQVRYRAGTIFLLTLMRIYLPCASLRAEDNDPNHPSGAWSLTITLGDNPVLPAAVHVLGDFTQDGSFIFSDSLGKFGAALSSFGLPAPFTQSPGHGQ